MSRRYYEWSMVVLRVALGVIFLCHGLQKVTGFAGTVKFFSSVGMPIMFVYVVTFIEVIGGVCLILGLFTRLAATAISLLMLGSIPTVLHMGKGFISGYDFNISLLAIAVALILSGSNTLSLGNRLLKR